MFLASIPSHVVLCENTNTSSALSPDAAAISESVIITEPFFARSRASIGGTNWDVCQKFKRTLVFFMDQAFDAGFSVFLDAALWAAVAGVKPAESSIWALIESGASL